MSPRSFTAATLRFVEPQSKTRAKLSTRSANRGRLIKSLTASPSGF
jgi:hypothetical protein